MQVGVSIVKQCAFRDSVQEFSNVYHYNFTGEPIINNTQADAIIDRLVVLEKIFHSGGVTFLRGSCWSSGGSPAANEMISQKALSGVGSATTTGSVDKERAFLVYWDAGVDSRSHPVKLRKWFHTCGSFSNIVTPTAAMLENATGLSVGERNAVVTAVNPLNPLTVAGVSGTGIMISKNGRVGSTGAHAHKYFEHHQLGDMWR